MIRNALLAAVAVIGLSFGATDANAFGWVKVTEIGFYNAGTADAAAVSGFVGGAGLASTNVTVLTTNLASLATGEAAAASLDVGLGWNGSSAATNGGAAVELNTDAEIGLITNVAVGVYSWRGKKVELFNYNTTTPLGSSGNTVGVESGYGAAAAGVGGPSVSTAAGFTVIGATSTSTALGSFGLGGGVAGATASNLTVGLGAVSSASAAAASVSSYSVNR